MKLTLVEMLIREFNYRRILVYLSEHDFRAENFCTVAMLADDLNLDTNNANRLIALGVRKGHLIHQGMAVQLTPTKGEAVISSLGFIVSHPVVLFLAAPIVSGAISGLTGALVRLAFEGALG